MRVRKHETKIGKTFARDEEDTWAQSGGRKDLADGREREGLVTSGKIFWINSPSAFKVAVGTWDSPLLGLALDPPHMLYPCSTVPRNTWYVSWLHSRAAVLPALIEIQMAFLQFPSCKPRPS